MRQMAGLLLAVVFLSNTTMLAAARVGTSAVCPDICDGASADDSPAPDAGKALLPPSVVLLGLDDGCAISSEDRPFSCTTVGLDCIWIEVHLPDKVERHLLPKPGKIACIQFFLDGEPVGRKTPLDEARRRPNEKLARYHIPCPTPGRHYVQARYLIDNRWSPLSRGLCVDVSLPDIPEIIAVGESPTALKPLAGEDVVTLSGSTLSFRLAGWQCDEPVAVYLDGTFVGNTWVEGCIAGRLINIAQDFPPGYYDLTVRGYGKGWQLSVASRAIPIHFQPKDKHLCAGSSQAKEPNGKLKGKRKLKGKGKLKGKTNTNGNGNTNDTTGESITSMNIAPAFRAIPKPRPIPMQEETANGNGDPKSRLNDPSVVRFYSTAHFPRRDFGPAGEVNDRTGAVIYEGMRFAAEADGNYEVDFLVSTPAVRTVLRLRLLLPETGKERMRAITLPPIRIEPKKGTDGRYQAGIWRIHHEGYSPAIHGSKTEIDEQLQELRREGTARFGFGSSLVRAH